MHRLSLCCALVLAMGCAKEADSPNEPDDTGNGPTDDRIWPGDEWATGSPEDHGMDSDALEALREYTFTAGFNTQALVVIKDGVLIAEWYSDGTDASSLVTSWSVGKSVMSSLFGVGLREGLVDLDDPVGNSIEAWSTGPNQDLTNRHLLEMRSGLPENTSNPYGVYGAVPDQLAYSLDRTPIDEPGQRFRYVNEDSMVLGEVLAQSFGEPVTTIVQDEVFGPLGMDAEWWVDGSGHALTYCCIDTTARDFARFGLLYARDGEWKGTQIVPTDYVEMSTTGISANGRYGLQWWTFGDFFAAIGLHGQYINVHPDLDLVVARFGLYTRRGTEAVRVGTQYHQTEDAGAFDTQRFYQLYMAAVQ